MKLGFGLGLRTPHYEHVLSQKPDVDWFEVISENFMVPGGRPRRILREVRENYPVVLHGVSMSIGSPGPLDPEYLRKLKELADEIEPLWFSDHLCWSSMGSHYSHDLLPLPLTGEALARLSEKIDYAQSFMGRPMLIENVSSYVQFKCSEMTEWEFLTELTGKTGCKLLLDVNNIYVSARNHGFETDKFIQGIPTGAVAQIHLAGHTDRGDIVIDTHDEDVRDEVWSLYRSACRRFGEVPTMIERDGNIPEFEIVHRELRQAQEIQKATINEKNRTQRNSESVLDRPRQLSL